MDPEASGSESEYEWVMEGGKRKKRRKRKKRTAPQKKRRGAVGVFRQRQYDQRLMALNARIAQDNEARIARALEASERKNERDRVKNVRHGLVTEDVLSSFASMFSKPSAMNLSALLASLAKAGFHVDPEAMKTLFKNAGAATKETAANMYEKFLVVVEKAKEKQRRSDAADKPPDAPVGDNPPTREQQQARMGPPARPPKWWIAPPISDLESQLDDLIKQLKYFDQRGQRRLAPPLGGTYVPPKEQELGVSIPGVYGDAQVATAGMGGAFFAAKWLAGAVGVGGGITGGAALVLPFLGATALQRYLGEKHLTSVDFFNMDGPGLLKLIEDFRVTLGRTFKNAVWRLEDSIADNISPPPTSEEMQSARARLKADISALRTQIEWATQRRDEGLETTPEPESWSEWGTRVGGDAANALMNFKDNGLQIPGFGGAGRKRRHPIMRGGGVREIAHEEGFPSHASRSDRARH